MCESHAGIEPILLRNFIMKVYAKWIEDTLGFYLFLGSISKIPVVGAVVRFFAGQYGKYLHGGKAATPEECEELLRHADYIAVINCSCRVKSNQRCGHELATCITVGRGAQVMGHIKNGEFVNQDQAVKLIRDCYNKGLIRSITHCMAPEVYSICNCCTCCCVPYRLRTEFGINSALQNGARVVKLRQDSCRLCRKCTETCPHMAIDLETGKVFTERCLGCGLCVGVCPVGALQMVDRADRQYSVSPGFFSKILIYAAFFTIILPIAVGYKMFHFKS